MDGQRFDRLTRSLAASSSRRGAFKGLAGVIIGALFAGRVDDAEAARACQTCRRGQCTPRPNGDRCGACGVCLDGVCVPDADHSCGACSECSGTSFRCVPRPNETACGDCGTCHSGRCRPNRDDCPNCASCKPVNGGQTYSCKSRCGTGKRCCPDDRCVASGACCSNEEQCGDKCCDRSTQRCTADGCCPIADVCGTGPNATCCTGGECINGDQCCRGIVCENPEFTDCCGNGEICCDSDKRCKAPEKCCPTCSECETCEDGECVVVADNTRCTESNGICCAGVCKVGADCCDDDGCPDCGRCDSSGQCEPNPAKNGQQCDGAKCKVCKDGQCVNQINNAGCFDSNALCCEGTCCANANETCCGGRCCRSDLCVNGNLCCDVSSGFTAADADLCCPFGPPCGSGANADCCDQDELCCNGTCKQGCGGECCDEPGDTCCVGLCCPAGKHCCDGRCQDQPCDCDQLCSDNTCCPFGTKCTTQGCCNNATHLTCGTAEGPCCDPATEQCIGTGTPSYYCCPKGVYPFLDGTCCPIDKPEGRHNDQEHWCCHPQVPFGQEAGNCTSTGVPGRHA